MDVIVKGSPSIEIGFEGKVADSYKAVDSALSTTSENPVQNKVVTEELGKKVNSSDLATINGQRIDEGGNIEIEGGMSEDEKTELNEKLTELSEEISWIHDPNDGFDPSIAQAYEEGLQECYIDSNKMPNIDWILIQCYVLSGKPCLYIRYKLVDQDPDYLVLAVPFSNINNFEQYNIFKDEECVGYIVFKDKQKFIDNPRDAGVPFNLNKVLRGNMPNVFAIADNAVTTEKIANNAVTTEKIARKAISKEKTDFIEVKVGNQLYDKSSMGVVGSWYYFGGASGVGNVVSLITNQYTGQYTAIKIPINWLKQITLSQEESLDGRVYSYHFVDDNMVALDYQINVKGILRIGYTLDIVEGASYLLLNILKYDESLFMANEGSEMLPYEPYKEDTYVNGINISSKDTKDKTSIELSLPNTIYAVVGDTLQLFYRGIIKAVNPYNYDILVRCEKGNQYPRYYEYKPVASDVGDVPFSICVKDNDGNVLAEKSCNIRVVNVPTTANSINVACFGDSLTAAGTWCSEAYRRIAKTGGNPIGNGLSAVKFIGAMDNNGAGYFGVGGWTWNNYITVGSQAFRFSVSGVTAISVGAYYTNNGGSFQVIEVNITDGEGTILCTSSTTPLSSGKLVKSSGAGDAEITYSSYVQDASNPLWDNNKMTFIPYVDKYGNGKLDIVYTLLSWNGHTPNCVDFTSIINQAKQFADTLHMEYPSAKLKILGLQVPSINGGMGANYGATGKSYSDTFGMVTTVLNLNKAYQDFANSEGYSDFVEFVNVSSQFDSEYNMPSRNTYVNTRNTSITEVRGTNGVHPSTEGYMQIADVVYRNMIANL